MNRLLTALWLTSSVLASSVLAQTAAVKQNVKYTAVQKLVKVSAVNGQSAEELVESPLTVVPGDVLSEEVTVQNVGAATLPQVVVSMPVPEGTVFTGAITPKLERVGLSYSTDGGRTYSTAPQRISSVTENGKAAVKKAAAALTDVTNVRWTISSLKAGETLKLTYRVRVS
ncbi:hypothetical protein [Deinococcus koreensis]|uniref:DUF11 domain-containing protein n=1 Tax=Deinococcus koreensis TaxID=2054903 RepID=A0A2K3UWI4_9DEIO|nr:hypothetical protein [Deinococcus koreensis]PNY80897.1 hypothetical protein CVO96_05510 [Deinococcus koreensis]